MGKRIIVRTTSNISYAGNWCENDKFDSEGIVVAPNAKLGMEVFIPKEEILEVIYNSKRITYDDYINVLIT